MAYRITEEDFKLAMNYPYCPGTEVRNGKAEEGHKNCGGCKGNYFVGGECNWGGRHTMKSDLADVNRNFEEFDDLVKKKSKLTSAQSEEAFDKKKESLLKKFGNLKRKCEGDGKDFFYGACIGTKGSEAEFTEAIKNKFYRLSRFLSDYIKRVENTTWKKIKDFREKIDTLDKMTAEYSKMAKDMQSALDRGDQDEANRILALMASKQKEIASFRLELEQDPTWKLFNEEGDEELASIVENIFRGDGNFFKRKKKLEDETDKKKQEQEKYFGIIPKKWKGKILWSGGIILLILFIVWLFKKFLNAKL